MPAYISHAIMVDKLYNLSLGDKNLLKNNLDLEELRGYSLGSDLASLSKRLKTNPHKEYTKDFFLYMIKYIKDNHLEDNKHVIALLYGHVAHYFLDINAHPFIYYLEKNAKIPSFIPAHQLIEGYLDSYLTENILHKDIMQINDNYFNKINLNINGVRDLLNDVYGHIYGDNDIVKTYKDTLKIFTIIEKIAKSPIVSRELLVIFSQFKEFLNINDLSIDDLNNEINNDYYNPVTGIKDNKSFLEMFYCAIYMTQDAINEINKYLYGDLSIDSLNRIFTNLSYNTGVSCSMGEKMVYVKKYR